MFTGEGGIKMQGTSRDSGSAVKRGLRAEWPITRHYKRYASLDQVTLPIIQVETAFVLVFVPTKRFRTFTSHTRKPEKSIVM